MALTTARPLLGHHRCLGGLTAVTVVKHYRRVEAACISLLFFFMTLGLVVSSQQSGHRSVSPIKASKKKTEKEKHPPKSDGPDTVVASSSSSGCCAVVRCQITGTLKSDGIITRTTFGRGQQRRKRRGPPFVFQRGRRRNSCGADIDRGDSFSLGSSDFASS